jgi:diamine N-acetyltransferase
MPLRTATSDDIPAIVALERLPASTEFVGQWSEDRHRSTLATTDARYYVLDVEASSPSPLRAYAILRGLEESSGSLELKRLVVHPPGRGLGKQVLAELLLIAFRELHAHRIFLDVFDDNSRAIHLYKSFGFVEEGLMREAARRDGNYCSLRLMSLLDHEFAQRCE